MHPLTNRLIKLLALNRSVPRDYKIEAAADGNEATLYLYDVIGYDFWTGGGVTAKQFAKDLKALGGKKLNLRVNSPGGDVFDGRAMAAALRDYPGEIVAHVDGLAASAASFLVMHADKVVMTEGSFMMIHNGWTLAMGDRHAMRKTGDLLEKIDGSIVDDYQKKSGIDAETLATWMDEETWFTAAEAVDQGLADSIAEGASSGVNNRAKAWNVGAYDNAPSELAETAAQTEEIEPPTVADEPAAEVAAAIENDLRASARERELRLIETTAA